jgi:intracellular multiplication protein IcmK
MNLMKNKAYNTYFKLFIALFSLSTLCFGAENTDSAQQALQQLRLFQSRLQPSPPPAGNTARAAAPTLQIALPLSDSFPAPPKNTSPGAPTSNVVIPNEPPVDTKEVIEDRAFEKMTQQIFPLEPEQLIRLKQRYQTQEYALTSPAGVPPKPIATSQFVNLSPGSTPPVIRLAQGFVSSLVFLDSTGAPWPIVAYDLGDPAAFNIQWDHTGNTLMIQALKLYNYGNMAVRLKGLNTPVMLTLIPGQKAVDYRVDLRIQGTGPNAKSLLMDEGLPPHADDVLLHILDGVAPEGSLRLTVSGGDALAWLLKGRMFVRTNLTILSPGWLATMTSADGMHAYEMMKSPVLLVSWHGKVMQLKVEGL